LSLEICLVGQFWSCLEMLIAMRFFQTVFFKCIPLVIIISVVVDVSAIFYDDLMARVKDEGAIS
jgi:hypothetical protein